MSIEISVIIPTFYDNEKLERCIEALQNQSISSDAYEIIVVNNSTEHLTFVTSKNLLVINEEKPGSYAARNAGIRAARGAILAFTDADCIPDSSWLESGAAAINKGRVHRVAGEITVFSNNKDNKKTAVECYETICAFDQEMNVAHGVSVTANLFVLADVFKKVGRFNETLYSCGDFEWNMRASSCGYSIYYCPQAAVFHPARRRWKEVAEKAQRVTGGIYSANIPFKSGIIFAILPPVTASKTIIKNRKANMREKILAFVIAYRVRIYRHICLYKIKKGKLEIKRA